METLRVLIVDDEPLARMRLAALLRECTEPACTVAGEAGDPASALGWLARHDCDVVLLDIQMPGASGLQLASAMRSQGRPAAIVFVTAHAEHALQAFELAATDYLTKPVRRDRLQQALQRVAAQRRTPAAVPAADEPVLVVTDRGRVVRVPLSAVLYLKAELKYVTLRTATHTYLLDESLTELEPRLGDRFIRVHRNALVARAAVRALQRRSGSGGEGDGDGAEGWAVRLEPVDEWLAVSRRQLPTVREQLGGGGL